MRELLKPDGVLFVSISDFVELAKLRRDPARLDHLTYYTSATLRDLVQQLGFQAERWHAPTYEESRRRHVDVRENAGPTLAVLGVLRKVGQPIRFATPDWRRTKADFDETRRLYHEPPPLAIRVLRRLGAPSV
jgi:hypothetical protein